MDREEAATRLQQLLKAGTEIHRALGILRAEGAGPIPSIYAVSRATGRRLGEAKEVVHGSPVWSDLREDWEKLDAFLEDAFRKADR